MSCHRRNQRKIVPPDHYNTLLLYKITICKNKSFLLPEIPKERSYVEKGVKIVQFLYLTEPLTLHEKRLKRNCSM